MEKILFINACVRENSRTLELARCILDKLNGEMHSMNSVCLKKVQQSNKTRIIILKMRCLEHLFYGIC